MRLRRELRNPWVVAPVMAAVLVAVLASSAAAVARPDLVFFRIGDKFAVIGWGMDDAEQEFPPPGLLDPPCPEGFDCDFGGYRLWVREVWLQPDPSPESFSLIREYVLGEDSQEAAGYWGTESDPFPGFWLEDPVCVERDLVEPDSCLTWREGVRRDSKEIFQNAFPYEFSVTAFSTNDPQAIDYEGIDANRTGVIYPRVGTRDDLAAVRCIPNPYRAAADWEYGGQRRVTFIGLPEKATIRIYTVAAAHVRTLIHEDAASDLEFWDLKNAGGEDIAPGVYIFQVESAGMASRDGKVMIIK